MRCFLFKGRHFGFSLPVTTYNIPKSHSEQLDFENIDKAV